MKMTTATEAKYEVILLDIHATEIATRGADTLKEAKRIGKMMLSDEYAASAETSHEAWETSQVQVLDKNGDCVWDEFRG
jgi:hypothetical protein